MPSKKNAPSESPETEVPTQPKTDDFSRLLDSLASLFRYIKTQGLTQLAKLALQLFMPVLMMGIQAMQIKARAIGMVRAMILFLVALLFLLAALISANIAAYFWLTTLYPPKIAATILSLAMLLLSGVLLHLAKKQTQQR